MSAAAGAGGAQSGAGFAAGAQQENASLTQGMSQGDIAALNKAGIQLVGPETKMSESEALVTQPQSMGGTGAGGQTRAVAASGGASPQAPARAAGGSTAGSMSGEGPSDPIPQIANLFSIIAGMGGTPQLMAEGGELPAGGTAIVGEAGQPEVVQAKPEGGATVEPIRAARGPEKSFAQKAGSKLADIAIGAAVGPKGVMQIQAQRAASAQHLAELGVRNPSLLRTSPAVAGAVDTAFGAGTADQLVQQADPNVQSRMLAQMYGIPLAPGNEFVQLTDEMGKRGWGAVVTSKGELRFNRAARSGEQQDAIRATGDYNAVFQNLMDQGIKESQAAQAAAKRVMAVAPHAGYSPPKWITDLANAGTDQDIKTALAASKEAAKQQVQLQFAEPKAQATELGRRKARVNLPISEDEIRVGNEIVAQDVGGVAFGRELKDDDLINADEQGLVLKQQPSGSYIGIPSDKVREDANVLAPRELLTRRVAQKIAGKKTTQHENAQIVLEGLNTVDDSQALSLLQPASQQGGSLGEQLAGAVSTELRGQTSGRLSLFAARRAPNVETREKAIALINIKTLATSVVKAMGDVGAISEADKAIIYDRFNRIANGVASREEAATQLQQLRTLMMHVASAGKIMPGSAEAEAMKQTAHEIIRGAVPLNQAPSGFTTIPGTGAFYNITPAQ